MFGNACVQSMQIQIRLPSFGLSRTTPHATSRGSTRFHTHVYNGTVTVETLAFLDEGSSLTLVEAALAEQLGLKGDPDPLELHWTSDVKRNEATSRRVSLQISAKGGERRYSIAAAHTINKLSLPPQNPNLKHLIRNLYYLQDIPLLTVDHPVPQVLIGLADVELLKPLETRSGQPGEPIAVRSALGWAIYGTINASNKERCQSAHYHNTHLIEDSHRSSSNKENNDQELNETMRQYFALEESAVCSFNKFLSEPEDVRRAKIILETTTTKCNGRYTTGLLWKSDDFRFPDSKPMAMARLRSLERKLEKDPDLKENVHNQIRLYVEKGFAHRAEESELNSVEQKRVWYLPLNVVGHPRKPDKKRLVWDAAAKVRGVSLNSELLKGPDLLVQLPTVLCKFRQRLVAFGGDIEKMFHQIRIREEDKHSQRFLFRFDPNHEPQTYIMDVATFGASCSPCSAQYIMHRNAEEHANIYPEAAAAIKQSTYMDDYFDSCDTLEEAINRAKQVRHIHAQAGFNMRNWVSNNNAVLEGLEESTSDRDLFINFGQEGKHPRVLGIIWDPVSDSFKFSANWHEELKPYIDGTKKPTKRIVLRIIMSLFDPLGLVAPVLIHGRMMMQDLWRDNLKWDDELNETQYNKFKRWTALLPSIHSLRIPRCYFGVNASNTHAPLQLHIFTDASELGYGCAAYFRKETPSGIRCALVMARSKVAPLQHLTIPKLELQAALLGARLKRMVCDSHDLEIKATYFHTDSEVVLSWIRTPTHELKQFVACRVGEILSLSDSKEWRHVPTKENPADCLTKWGKDTMIDPQGRWLNGPAFLYLNENNWPAQKPIEATNQERKTCYISVHSSPASPHRELVVDAFRISSWKVLVRTVANLWRFVSNCRRKAKGLPIQSLKATKRQIGSIKQKIAAEHTPLTSEEYQKAERFLLQNAQMDAFEKEVQVLAKSNSTHAPRTTQNETAPQVPRNSTLYGLTPFLDEFGILRIDGRTAKAHHIPFDTRYPIILPKTHYVTTLILREYHQRFGHANNETVVNEVRQRFYLKHLRSSVARIAKNCQRCKIKKTQPLQPRMAPLPEARLTPYVRPFCKVGVDYLGPIEVVNSRRKEKRYIAVFTCLVTRAVHLEVAHSLSTEACIMAIRRFVSRRGAPSEIFSDNGTNFVGANNELTKQLADINYSCAETFTGVQTRWIFNPPSALHMGGAWERMVRSVKEAMLALDDGRKLNDEILLTALADSESLINSRPLTYMPQSSSNAEALTPNHFLLGSSCGTKEQLRPNVDLAETLRSSYKRSTALADAMWDRWLKEYLPALNTRSKWHEDTRRLNVGDLVFIAEGPRKNWLRAKVEETIAGKDGRIRQVVVRTANGKSLKRPVVKIAVLDVECDCDTV
ncbi:uncharacterized protein LOC121598785 [Anopheles merus]|uniref:uncharacterized protein LOC121598785 n=1 Tax=Anopheles merus TaxID=30066 RepID=UPI001BE47A35|nr:uncharacterized protein LOC121598785 [Anopheles merus]